MRPSAPMFLFAAAALVSLNTAATAQLLVSENLGDVAYSASGTYLRYVPPSAFDGEFQYSCNYWNSGGYSPQWIEVDLLEIYSLYMVRLMAAQRPAGETAHEVWIANRPIGENTGLATRVHTFEGFTTDWELIEGRFNEPCTARYVQIRTIRSPSWVAWMEIQVYAVLPQ